MSSASGQAPFFIIGPGRSGNTLLRRLLFEQTNACIPDEIYAIGDVIRLSKQALPWNDFVDRSIEALQGQQDGDLLRADFSALRSHALNLPLEQQHVGSFIASFYEYECRAYGKNEHVAGDKTPLNTFAALDLANVFPEARFAFMLRFPVDVVSSYVEAGLCGTHEAAIDRVQRSYAVYRRLQFRTDCMPVCYEELVKDTERVLDDLVVHLRLRRIGDTAVGAFRDVQRHGHHANVSAAISSASIGKGLSVMPQRSINLCRDLVDQYFALLQHAGRPSVATLVRQIRASLR